jgi:hypothetical protein
MAIFYLVAPPGTAWIACIADAQSIESYVQCLRLADLELGNVELHNEALTEIVQQIRMKLLGTEIIAGLNKLNLRGVDFSGCGDAAWCGDHFVFAFQIRSS